ncbi:MAG: CRISPR system precrRNA processing endoribonuclease RAMP protein Cas6, partial [Anaerolineales bacterium]|nr:CRISPR system precrRNA processing endoribonuclease RAMP protein Cas6 [Anaerolineales bacterium]
GALGQVMTRTYCAGDIQDAAHVNTCPVHWLLAANEKPGQERRGYAIVPPEREISPERRAAHSLSRGEIPLQDPYEPGERFEFGITLFGHALKFLPYFVLAVPEMGRAGVGPGRGKFALKSVWAENPLTRERECLLTENDNLVRTPTLIMTHHKVLAEVEHALQRMVANGVRVIIHFRTPTRLIEDGRLAQAPKFDIFFARLLKRLDELNEQFGAFDPGLATGDEASHSARRGAEAARALHELAGRVWLQSQETRWVEVWSGSNRRGTPSPLSGIVGSACYMAPSSGDWGVLMPWLLWGQLAQVGKSTVKGNGVIGVN